MNEATVVWEMSWVDVELVDALVVAAVEKLDERLRAMSLLDRATQQEEVTRLMRERYLRIGRRLDELRQRAVMVPA